MNGCFDLAIATHWF